MKILAVCGNDLALRRKVAQTLVEELEYCRYQVVWWRQESKKSGDNQILPPSTLWSVHDHYSHVYVPGQFTLEDSLSYLSHDFVVAEGEQGAVPQLVCAANETELLNCWTPLTLAGVFPTGEAGKRDRDRPMFGLDQIKDLVKFLIDALPERVPFLEPNPCCGACGWPDCQSKLADVIKGKADMDDCAVLNSKVEVKIGGQELALVPFVQDVIIKTVSGLLSTLNGYREHCPVEIKIK